MHALKAQFELFDAKNVRLGTAGARHGVAVQNVRKTGTQKIAAKYKKSGNEPKEYLKTKEITFLDAANSARFSHRLAANWPRKEQKTPRLAKMALGHAKSDEARRM